jgi:organic hydroperoxide reductase OsmC/OhrA
MSETQSAHLSWTGSTADPAYGRNATVTKPGGQAPIPVSAMPSFSGDGTCFNPENLLAAAMATCHMLTFLSLAAKVRLEVLGYDDAAEAAMETVDRISRVATITLRPRIRVAPGTDHAKVVEMFDKAHKYCVIANSYNGTVLMEPTVVEA